MKKVRRLIKTIFFIMNVISFFKALRAMAYEKRLQPKRHTRRHVVKHHHVVKPQHKSLH